MSCARSPSDKAREAVTEIRSLDATLRLIDTAAVVGAIPEHFAEDAREALAEGRAQAQAKLEQARAP